jgi:predicted nucleic acid-binding protein
MQSVLIDSSAWIEFLRNSGISAVADQVERCLKAHSAALCPVVWMELHRGAQGKRELAELANLRQICLWLEIDSVVWEAAAELSRKARMKGLNCPMADVLISACAKRHGAALLHQDKHLAALVKL